MSEVSGAGRRVATRDLLAAKARRLTGAAWRLGPEQVGPRGLSLLAVVGLVGVVLAVHGYGHGALIAAGPGGVGAPTPAAGSHSSSTTGSHARSATGSHARSAAGSHARAGAKSHSGSASSAAKSTSAKAASQKLGPLLSSTQYAPYSYQVYPGPESSRARLATAGFTIQVTPHSGALDLSVSASGSGQGAQTSTLPAGDRVYFIEATFGDDSGSADYNFGDDGVVVTNPHGYVVQ